MPRCTSFSSVWVSVRALSPEPVVLVVVRVAMPLTGIWRVLLWMSLKNRSVMDGLLRLMSVLILIVDVVVDMVAQWFGLGRGHRGLGSSGPLPHSRGLSRNVALENPAASRRTPLRRYEILARLGRSAQYRVGPILVPRGSSLGDQDMSVIVSARRASSWASRRASSWARALSRAPRPGTARDDSPRLGEAILGPQPMPAHRPEAFSMGVRGHPSVSRGKFMSAARNSRNFFGSSALVKMSLTLKLVGIWRTAISPCSTHSRR